MENSNLLDYGPLALLAGIWEGQTGEDLAPDDSRVGVEKNNYRERLVLHPIGRIDNHDQKLYGLRYSTMAWRIGEKDSFHEEVGYWLWDSQRQIVMRSFIVPRGVTVLAGGLVEPSALSFSLSASLGSPTFGICSNPFLDQEFKTIKYELHLTIHDENSFSYDEDTHLSIKGMSEIFHHTDKHQLFRVPSS